MCINLGTAFNNVFEKRAGYLRFKSKWDHQSIQYPQHVKVLDNGLRLPKIGEVKAVLHCPIDGKLRTVTVSKNRCDQYFASVLFDDGKPEPTPSTNGKAVGIDLGLTDFAVTSDGSKVPNPRWLATYERNLKRKQKALSRKRDGSSNRNKARKRVARVHDKIARCRDDFLHKLSRRIVEDNQVICVENLNVKGMVNNRCLAKPISQVGWGMFIKALAP
ncbi:transposase [Synechococcus sp. PCC 6716]|nr:transposase [Synechococcus sp. PCC 6716]